MSSGEVVVSILAATITALIGVVVSLVLRSQSKFEGRMEKHISDLREDVHLCSGQILVLRTIIIMQLPPEIQAKLDRLDIFGKKPS